MRRMEIAEIYFLRLDTGYKITGQVNAGISLHNAAELP
jgi:hypothetical protein